MFLSAAGIFMLHEKYHTLNSVNFTQEGKPPIEGHMVAEKLKDKNSRLPLYPAFVLLAMTKNLKCFYANIDTAITGNSTFSMTVFDKIYG